MATHSRSSATTKRDSPSPTSTSTSTSKWGVSSPSPSSRKSPTTSKSKPNNIPPPPPPHNPTRTRRSLLSKPKSPHPISVSPTATPSPSVDSDLLIASLQSQVFTLTSELQKAQTFNLHLQSLNSNLSLQLDAANSIISNLTTTLHQSKSAAEPKFQGIQNNFISNKLQNPPVSCKQEEAIETNTPIAPVPDFTAKTIIPEQSSVPSPPPPPPPPLPRRPAARAVTTQKVSAVVELYQSLATKRGNRYPPVPENSNKTTSAHNSIVDEFQNRSAHLIAIKMDIETKGGFINGLIQKVLAATYTDIEDVLSFVDWLDKELSLLADEQAVLKHFKWPEKKADAMREAAIEYRNLKLIENEVSSYKDDTDVPCGVALKKMACLLDKSERSLQRLIQLRNSAMLSYQAHKIPTDWMLDSGFVSKIKQALINLAKTYVKRVTVQLESIRYSERESTQEALLLQGVNFAYRAHQFCGGLDSETLCAFEEIRRRVPGHLKGSPQLFAGIPSS